MTNSIRTIFMGTPDFGLPSFKALVQDPNFEIIAVVSQPDKKVGRKQELTPPPIKSEALIHNIPVWQPTKIKEISDQIKEAQPDLIVVIAYGQIIPQAILDIPKYGCINVHGSLLPKYRGAACVQASILNGDKESGITIMKMEAGLDTGPIIHQEKVNIEVKETSPSLYEKLSQLAAEILPTTLKQYIQGEIKATPQNDNQASYIKTINKEDGKLNWNEDALNIERKIRAFNPWPGTYGQLPDGQLLKILEVHNIIEDDQHELGQLFLTGKDLAIKARNGALVVAKLQLAGKGALDAKTWLAGQNKYLNSILK